MHAPCAINNVIQVMCKGSRITPNAISLQRLTIQSRVDSRSPKTLFKKHFFSSPNGRELSVGPRNNWCINYDRRDECQEHYTMLESSKASCEHQAFGQTNSGVKGMGENYRSQLCSIVHPRGKTEKTRKLDDLKNVHSRDRRCRDELSTAPRWCNGSRGRRRFYVDFPFHYRWSSLNSQAIFLAADSFFPTFSLYTVFAKPTFLYVYSWCFCTQTVNEGWSEVK